MVICLERGADLHMAQLMPLPLTVSCFSKIQIGFTFLVLAHPGSPGKRAVKRVCVYRSTCNCRHLQLRTEEDFVGAKFYCPHGLADGNQRIRITEKTMKFCSTVISTLSPYCCCTGYSLICRQVAHYFTCPMTFLPPNKIKH